jgi:nicotinate-nucleotide adenylyltransferase
MAMKQLNLHEIWWLLTPCNPLKKKSSLLPLQERLRKAAKAARHPRIKVKILEPALGTVYTVPLLRRLKERQPWRQLFWLMGSDNLEKVQQWQAWSFLFKENKIVIFPRPGYTVRIGKVKAAHRFKAHRGSVRCLRSRSSAVSWTVLEMPMHPLSATQLRQQRLRSTESASV